MKKLLFLPVLMITLLSLNSCKLPESDTESETTPTPQTESSPEEEGQEETAEEEVEPEEEQEETSTVVGLKKATNPEDFVGQRGGTPGERRNDPFSLFPVPPQQSQAEIETLEAQREAAEESDTGGESAESLPSLPQEGSPQAPPAPPEPEMARAIQVQGAIRIGNSSVAILKAPNDLNSRYVRPGNFIAGGQVLLKRINMEDRPTPTVVLEELGVDQEVIKAVAEARPEEAEEAEETEQSVLPPPPPPPAL